jgi:hypothetical protein
MLNPNPGASMARPPEEPRTHEIEIRAPGPTPDEDLKIRPGERVKWRAVGVDAGIKFRWKRVVLKDMPPCLIVRNGSDEARHVRKWIPFSVRFKYSILVSDEPCCKNVTILAKYSPTIIIKTASANLLFRLVLLVIGIILMLARRVRSSR